MKRTIIVAVITAAALLAGCGGDSTPTNSDETPTENSSDVSSTDTQSETARSAYNLAGFTVTTTKPDDATVFDIARQMFIFLAGNEIIIVTDQTDGTRIVASGSYTIGSQDTAPIITIEVTDEEGNTYNTIVYLNDDSEIVVGETLIGPYFASAIISSEDDGFDESTVDSGEGSDGGEEGVGTDDNNTTSTPDDDNATSASEGDDPSDDSGSGDSGTSVDSTYVPITTHVTCDPEPMTTAPYRDNKYAAEGNIAIVCDDTYEQGEYFKVVYQDGSSTVALQSIHAEVYSNTVTGWDHITHYDYTPEAFVITYYEGRDIMGNLVQESCNVTYAPVDLSEMEPYMIHTVITAPYIGNLGDRISTTCDENIFTFGKPPAQAPDVIYTQSNITFTDTEGDAHKVSSESLEYPE